MCWLEKMRFYYIFFVTSPQVRVRVGGDGEFIVDAKVSDFNVSGILMDSLRMSDWPPYFVAPEALAGGVCRYIFFLCTVILYIMTAIQLSCGCLFIWCDRL